VIQVSFSHLIDSIFEKFENRKEHAVKRAIDLLSELTSYTIGGCWDLIQV